MGAGTRAVPACLDMIEVMVREAQEAEAGQQASGNTRKGGEGKGEAGDKEEEWRVGNSKVAWPTPPLATF